MASEPEPRAPHDGELRPMPVSWIYLSPLGLTLLPLIRVAFRSRPVLRDRLFYAAIGAGVIHGVALISGSYNQRGEEAPEFPLPPSARPGIRN